MQRSFSICRLSLWISLLALVAACSNPDGFEELDSGSMWKLHQFGDQRELVDSAELVFLNALSIDFASGDTIESFEHRVFRKGKDELWKVLRSHYVGDSLEYISVERDFLHPGTLRYDTLRYFIKVAKMRTESQLKDARLVELTTLDTIARSDSVKNYYEELDGIYVNRLNLSLGQMAEEGKELVIHYRGYDLSGKVVDDTWVRRAPFAFVLGNEHQVIPALEKALYTMRKGERVRIIAPSWEAFGGDGVGENLIRPFSTMVFELELVDVAQ